MSGPHCKSVLSYCMWYPGKIEVLNWIEYTHICKLTRWRPIPHVISLMMYCFWFSHTHLTPFITCVCISKICYLWISMVSHCSVCMCISPVLYEYVDQPSVVCVCVCVCVCVDQPGTWSRQSPFIVIQLRGRCYLLFTAFTCFTTVHIKLHWAILKRIIYIYIYHWVSMTSNFINEPLYINANYV